MASFLFTSSLQWAHRGTSSEILINRLTVISTIHKIWIYENCKCKPNHVIIAVVIAFGDSVSFVFDGFGIYNFWTRNFFESRFLFRTMFVVKFQFDNLNGCYVHDMLVFWHVCSCLLLNFHYFRTICCAEVSYWCDW